MSCTAAEIAEKRRQAMERLNQKKKQNNSNAPASTSSTVTSPGTTSKPSSTFYGSSSHQKADELTEYEKKIRSSPKHYSSNRILSQPYSTRGKTTGQSNAPSTSTNAVKNNVVPGAAVASSLQLISESRFEVSVAGYHAELIKVFKTVSTRSYDTNTRNWSFNLTDYDLVRERVSCLHPQVTIGSLPKFVLNLLKTEKKELDFSCMQAIEPKLSSQLLNFQKYGVAFGISNAGRCMIADDMGLGKTYQAIAIADFYKDDWPLLICTTATAGEGWERHIRDLLPWVPSQMIGCLTSTQDHIGDFKVLITSYSLMDKNIDRLMQKNFGFIILDESHTIKNFKTKAAKSATMLGEKAKRIVLLSGTPALSRPAELFPQLNLIDKKFFGGFKEYAFRYCAAKNSTFGFDASGQSNLQELNVILKRKFMIRRTKEDVEFELGEKSRETILLDPSKVWNNKNESIRENIENCKEFSADIMKYKGKQREEVLLRFYAETANLKASAVCSYIEGLVHEKVKFIVFGHHQVMLNALTDCLKKMKVKFIRIDGSTKQDLRMQYIDCFQKEDSCQVAVLSLKACNAAITLTSASMVVFAELDWNPSTLAQCESRAHRIGQKSPVVCRYLLAEGTADDYIWECLKRKQNVLNKAGIFSEDLSDASHSAVPIAGSKQITSYFDVEAPKTENAENDAVNQNNNLIKSNELKLADSFRRMLEDDDEGDAALLELDF